MNKKTVLSAKVIPVVALAALGGCATTPEIDPVAQQLGSHQQQLDDIRSSISQLQAAVEGIGAAGIGSSMSSIEEEMRSLRGDVDALQYQLRDMQQRRAQVAGLGGGAGRAEVTPPAPQTSATASSPSQPAQNSDDQSAYLAAFGKLKSGAYDDAIGAFRSFLDKYSASAYAPNAQYWIGEAFYVQKKFDEAWDSFQLVGERYPDSLKAADARLKQGLIRVEQGDLSEARKILQEVSTKHAGSSAARLASERLQRMGGR